MSLNRQRRRVPPPAAVVLLLAACPLLAGAAAKSSAGAAGATLRLPPGAEQASRAIDADAIRSAVRFLSDDLLQGRAPASQGDRLARLYLSSRLEALGFVPGGPDGRWQQRFDMVGITADVPKTWTFHGDHGELSLATWDDFIAASAVQSETASIDGAEVVFVGYGIQAPEYQWDDFKGADLHGKVLLMLNNDPDWDPQLFAGERRLYYGRWTYKYESAARQGAAGAIIVHTTPSAGYPWQVVQSSWSGTQFELPAEGEPRVQVAAWTTEQASRRLVRLAGRDLDELIAAAHRRDFHPVPLGVTTSLTLHNQVEKVETANVAGLLRGSDPQLADEVVVYTAHHDHLGVGEPDASGDKIYNGARDNASGDGMVLAIAKAYSRLPRPPRRSVLFLFVAAEEQGLLGSEYYAAHPTFPAGKIAANVNFDSGNIWGRTRDVVFIGFGKSSLDRQVEAAAARQGRTVRGDQFPSKGYYYRSDQFNFAKIGVPAVYLDPGTDFVDRPEGWGRKTMDAWVETNYHQPSDELTPDWNFAGMIEDARLGFLVGLSAAESTPLPAWKPGDEFEAARKKALAAVAGGD